MEKEKYKDVVVIGSDHYNPLWVVRSLGMAGYAPTLLVIKDNGRHSYISKSRYVKQYFILKRDTEIISKLLSLNFPTKTAMIYTY